MCKQCKLCVYSVTGSAENEKYWWIGGIYFETWREHCGHDGSRDWQDWNEVASK